MSTMKRRDLLKLSLGALGIAAIPAFHSPSRNSMRRAFARIEPSLARIAVRNDTWLIGRVDPFFGSRAQAVMEGLQVHGYAPYLAKTNVPGNEDISVMALYTQPKVIEDVKERGVPLLIIEQGFFHPRQKFITLAWNGYNGRGIFRPAPADDNGERFNEHFSHLLEPWKRDRPGYTLVMGQRPDIDLKMRGIDIEKWAQDVTDTLTARGETVYYRPHPGYKHRLRATPEKLFIPKGATETKGTIQQDLEGARYCVTFCSNVSIDSVLAGVPTVAMDEGALAWPVCSHTLDEPLIRPDRTQWCHDMAWRHWTFEEVTSGKAWAFIKEAVELPV